MKIRLEIEGKNASSVSYKGPDAAELAANYLDSIEADEVQVNLANDDGTKAFAEFEGEFCNLSATKFILSTVKSKMDIPENTLSRVTPGPELTLRERLEMFLKFEFQRSWFSSFDVKRQYEGVYGNINLSTVSTYLARMHRNGILEKRGNRTRREYRLKEEIDILKNIEYASIK